jgi:tungstate transport system ATP-binding protein
MLRRSALANIRYALAVNGVPEPDRARLASSALARVGLTDIAHRPARVLSGGEQQRLALARAWALKPGILFLDEPTASLDPGATAEIERVIASIAAEGTRIVMTTHNLGQARRLADEIVFIHAGKAVERTAADRFFDKPASNEAALFLQGELPWK